MGILSRSGILLLLACFAVVHTLSENEVRSNQAKTALEYVEKVRTSKCSGGTEEVLPLKFDHTAWTQYADVAIRMANLLTKLVIQGNNSLGHVSDEFLFNLVRNNVDGDTLIFGSAIAVEEYVFPKYRIFCPYAYRKNGVRSHDLSLNYNYLDPSTEWYNTLRIKNWSNASITSNLVTYRYNGSHHDVQETLTQPMARLSDGHWTFPYFDCGGGDIWMTTYSAPIFGRNKTSNVTFIGIGTIDIELTNIDINQCDTASNEDDAASSTDTSVDVFRGTHQCRPTTECIPIKGLGFQRGSYICQCMKGYYFPDLSAVHKFYNGSDLENFFSNESNATSGVTTFTCLKCAEGCDECVDDSPCLYSYKHALRIPLLFIAVLEMITVIIISCVVYMHSSSKVIKAASPMFLHIMSVGAIFMYCQIIVMYPEPSDWLCALKPWPRFLGFTLAYGALLLKTWRISAIFRVKSAKRLNLSDKVLAQRIIPIVGVATGFLCAWTVAGRSMAKWLRTPDQFKFLICGSSGWEYAALGGEVLFLLWGAYLCYVVRKAPSQFNESKYITWAIYNNVILGSFIIIITELIAVREGPDVIYLMAFLHAQVSVTSMMCLIYIPKFYALHSSQGYTDQSEGGTATVTPSTVTEKKTTSQSGGTKDIGIQTSLSTWSSEAQDESQSINDDGDMPMKKEIKWSNGEDVGNSNA